MSRRAGKSEAPPAREPELDIFGKSSPTGDWSHRRGEPRGLLLGWTVYLMAASVVSLGAGAPMMGLDPLSYRPGARKLVVLIAIGLAVLFPVLRLSQHAPPDRRLRSLLRDVLVMIAPPLALLWPQVFLAGWPVSVVLALTACLLAWTLVAGGIVALVYAPGGKSAAARWIAAVAVVVVAFGGPAVLAARPSGREARLGPMPGWMLSPITGGYEIVRDRSWSGRPARVDGGHWSAIGMTGGLAGILWLGAGVARVASRERPA
ncbi:MAG: hypothetical protein AAFR38_13810 [Planctomycetota bacterium]